MASKDKSIVIVGGGTFGTSAAYHLSRQGYKHVKVLDRSAPPSQEAAGTDINKVIRADYPNPLYASLATDSQNVWNDPDSLLGGLYTRTGWVYSAEEGTTEFITRSSETAAKLGFEPARPIHVNDVRKRWPMLDGGMEGWHSFHNPSAGWANAKAGLLRMAKAAMNGGVKYISGEAGHVSQLLFDEQKRCIGVRCHDGQSHYADTILLAAGAYSPALLDLKGQLVAKGHCVGHIQLNSAEVEKYRDMPIVAHLQGGILFPPQEDGIMKIGAMNFVTNYAPAHRGTSIARYRSDHPGDGLPEPIETHLRSWMKEFVPELAGRTWFETRICWDADTADYNFLIAPHPDCPGLNLAVGGSAHGFKFLPVIGKYIVDMLEHKLDPEIQKQWRWRPGAKLPPGAVDPHPTPLLDLNDIPGWGRPASKL